VQTVEVITDHEVKWEACSCEVIFVPVSIGSLCDAKPINCALGLRGIGLTRCDLNDALSQPLWRDPTVVLAHRYCERRRVRRAVAAELIKRASPPLVPGADTFSLPPRDPPARLTL